MENKLLPCPFCGGEAKTFEREIPYDSLTVHTQFKRYVAKCEKCDAEISVSDYEKEKLAPTWNRRASPANPPLTCEECAHRDSWDICGVCTRNAMDLYEPHKPEKEDA